LNGCNGSIALLKEKNPVNIVANKISAWGQLGEGVNLIPIIKSYQKLSTNRKYLKKILLVFVLILSLH